MSPKVLPKIDFPDGVASCVSCHKYLRAGFALSLMAHLSREHQMHEDLAINTAERMLDLLSAAKTKAREQRK